MTDTDMHKTRLSSSASVTIAAPPEQVFDWVSDLPRMAMFSPECERCEWVDGHPAAAGATFKGFNRIGPFRWWTQGWVVTVDRPRRLVFRTSAAFEPRTFPVTEWTYVLEPDARGTRVSERVAILELVRLARRVPFLAQLRVRHLQRGMAATLERLRAEIEGCR